MFVRAARQPRAPARPSQLKLKIFAGGMGDAVLSHCCALQMRVRVRAGALLMAQCVRRMLRRVRIMGKALLRSVEGGHYRPMRPIAHCVISVRAAPVRLRVDIKATGARNNAPFQMRAVQRIV